MKNIDELLNLLHGYQDGAPISKYDLSLALNEANEELQEELQKEEHKLNRD